MMAKSHAIQWHIESSHTTRAELETTMLKAIRHYVDVHFVKFADDIEERYHLLTHLLPLYGDVLVV